MNSRNIKALSLSVFALILVASLIYWATVTGKMSKSNDQKAYVSKADCAVHHYNQIIDYQIAMTIETKKILENEYPYHNEVLEEFIDLHLKKLDLRKFMANETLRSKPELLNLAGLSDDVLGDGIGKVIGDKAYSYVHLHLIHNPTYKIKYKDRKLYEDKFLYLTSPTKKPIDEVMQSKKFFFSLMNDSEYNKKIHSIAKFTVNELCK